MFAMLPLWQSFCRGRGVVRICLGFVVIIPVVIEFAISSAEISDGYDGIKFASHPRKLTR